MDTLKVTVSDSHEKLYAYKNHARHVLRLIVTSQNILNFARKELSEASSRWP